MQLLTVLNAYSILLLSRIYLFWVEDAEILEVEEQENLEGAMSV
jgi:hypothetical protein